uniref:Uncharacterized protein n=1 Tax=Knipowitschia caucasica TaxID=637954 RepID=A0AAV2JP40_KNICA
MAVAVNKDLTVQVLADSNALKLMDSKQALRTAVQRGESKSLGVSQLMLGLLVMMYSIPLHLTEHTEVVLTGVPWWSGLTVCDITLLFQPVFGRSGEMSVLQRTYRAGVRVNKEHTT